MRDFIIHAAQLFGNKRTQCGLASTNVVTTTQKRSVTCRAIACQKGNFSYWRQFKN